jgi:hypothetical protein
VHDFFVSSETNSKAIMRTIIRHWGLPYDDTMIDRPRPFASKFVFMNKAEEDIYLRDAAGLFENMNSGAIRRDIPTHNLASRKEIDSINQNLDEIFSQVRIDCIKKCGLVIAEH